jgi:glycosyltransferase involved in cell wall biosynthesis
LREQFPAAQLELACGHPRVDLAGVTAHGPLDLADTAGREKAERLFESATCFVMPSRFEPFGMVYAEAAAAGVPSIGSTEGGATDAIGDGGLLVEPGDESALLNAMVAMCDPGKAAALGRSALARADLFTWTAVARRLVRILALPPVSSARA